MSVIQDLIKKGYDLRGPIQVDTSELTKMGITTESINDTPREDKSVTVSSNGGSKRVSSMMFGYNKAKIKLKDGSFANTDELIAAMEDAVSKQEEGTLIINEKGETLTPEQMRELMAFVAEAAGKVIIGEQSEKITNQTAPKWGVQGPSGKVHSKGAVFLGNGGIQLPSGEYVSVEELEQALSEYMILVPKKKEEPIPPVIPEPDPEPKPEPDPEPEPSEPEQTDPEPIEPEPDPIEPTDPEQTPNPTKDEKVLKVTRKYKNRASIWCALLSVTLAAILALGIAVKPIEVERAIDRTVIEYQMQDGVLTEEQIVDLVNDIINKYKMGEDVTVKDGQEFGVTSNPEETTKKTMGEEFKLENKEAGEYRISGFAIWYDGNIYEFLEDFNGELTDPSIGQYIDEVCEKHNLPKDEIDFMVHVGTNSGTRLGWIDLSELINSEDLTQEVIDKAIENSQKFFDRIENFKGDKITLSNGDVISLYKEDGTMIQNGDVVTSERGIQYTVNNIRLENVQDKYTEVVGEEKNLIFDFTAPEIAISMAPLVAALAFAIANHKKNKQAKENPAFVSVANSEEKERFVKEFQKAKEEYEKTSNFGKVMKRIFFRKEIDQMQELTEEQMRELYDAIERHANRDFVLGSNDSINIKNGRILIEYHDGGVMDITDIVMQDLYSIGQENPVEEEGLYNDEVRRRF